MDQRPSRRRFLTLAGGSVAAGLTACTASAPSSEPSGDPTTAAAPAPDRAVRVAADGARQAGVVSPLPPQPNLLSIAFDLSGAPGPVLAALGHVILQLTGGTDPHLAGMDPGDLTLTVGVGPRLVAAVDPALPGAAALPRFSREKMTDADRVADVLVQICASDALLLPGCATAVSAVAGLTVRWQQRAFRGPNVQVTKDAAAPRNLLGFVDGIIGPRIESEFAKDVYLPSSARLANASIMVVRRMEIDLDRFLAHTVADQEDIVGRRRASAAPLSGGSIATDPDLGAKTPAGAYLIPADAHLRRANPASTGVPPMLRRSYSFDDTVPGLFFVSFQNALATFVSTLNRMDTKDALLEYTTTTRSGTFLVLPGFSARQPLGATLFG